MGLFLFLFLAVLLAPLVVNVYRWRDDLQRVRRLRDSESKISLAQVLRHGAQRVSFLIAAWNEESNLQACLEAIEELGYPDREIIVCAGGSDRTFEIASQHAKSTTLRQSEGEGKQKALARCLEQSSGSVIYLLDAGTRITPAAFARMMLAIIEDGEQAVTALPCMPVAEQKGSPFVASQSATRVYTSLAQPEYCTGLLGANSVLTRAALEQAGGFADDVRTGIDYGLGQRLRRQGFRIRYDVRAVTPAVFRSGVAGYIRQQARWLRNVVVHGRRFGATREVIAGLATSAVGLAMLAGPWIALAAARWSPPAGAAIGIAWAATLVHAFLARVRYVKIAALWLGIRWPRGTIALIPAFLLVDLIAWTIPLLEYPSKRGRERW